jgi:hypothetical protein
MTDDSVVTQPSQDMDQGNRKRPAPTEDAEELQKKRLRDNANAQLPEAAEGKAFSVTSSSRVFEFIEWELSPSFMCHSSEIS